MAFAHVSADGVFHVHTRDEGVCSETAEGRLATYLRTAYPEVWHGSVVDTALWLLEHLRRVETMQPPVLRTVWGAEQAATYVQATVTHPEIR
jgi:hypothetical protein